MKNTKLKIRLRRAEKLFRRCEKCARDLGGVDFAPLALFRSIMQMGDAIALLAARMRVVPTVPLLRSMLDSFFSLLYVLGKNADKPKSWEQHRHRSLWWLVFCINQEIALKEMVDPTTPRGKNFRKELRPIKTLPAREIRSYLGRKPADDHDVQSLRLRLDEPDLVKFQQAYDAIKRKPTNFFTLADDSINHREELAKRVDQWPLYKIFYNPFSAAVHGNDPLVFLQDQSAGSSMFRPLSVTSRKELKRAENLADSILLSACVALAEHYGQVREENP